MILLQQVYLSPKLRWNTHRGVAYGLRHQGWMGHPVGKPEDEGMRKPQCNMKTSMLRRATKDVALLARVLLLCVGDVSHVFSQLESFHTAHTDQSFHFPTSSCGFLIITHVIFSTICFKLSSLSRAPPLSHLEALQHTVECITKCLSCLSVCATRSWLC